ncbi:MAG: RidA family protein, partial [Candidatus Binatia bacterium]
MTVSNLTKVTIFLSSREYAEANSRIRQEFLGGHNPALTVVITGIFDESWLIEVEATAAA